MKTIMRLFAILTSMLVGGAVALVAAPFLVPDANGWASWAQAFGSVAALGVVVLVSHLEAQRARQEKQQSKTDLSRAAGALAKTALSLVTDRLNAALATNRLLNLREYRATEIVAAMRELDVSSLPHDLIVHFSEFRACVFAINQRITDNYAKEEKDPGRKQKRVEKLTSCIRVYQDAASHYRSLQQAIQDQAAWQPEDVNLPSPLDAHIAQTPPVR